MVDEAAPDKEDEGDVSEGNLRERKERESVSDDFLEPSMEVKVKVWNLERSGEKSFFILGES